MHVKTFVKFVALAAALVLLVALPCLADEAPAPAEKPAPLEVTLARLNELLARLGADLDAVDRPVAERLGERVDEAAQLVADLVSAMEDSSEGTRALAVRLDLTLHRLVALLEQVIGDPRERPERGRARGTLDELRAWVDGYVAGATTGMSAREAERFSRAAHDLARALAAQMAKVAQRAELPAQSQPTLPGLVARLDALVARLDQILLDRASAPEPES